MDALSLRVKGDGSFNLESVLNPLKGHISMAIMTYHGNAADILHKVKVLSILSRNELWILQEWKLWRGSQFSKIIAGAKVNVRVPQ